MSWRTSWGRPLMLQMVRERGPWGVRNDSRTKWVTYVLPLRVDLVA